MEKQESRSKKQEARRRYNLHYAIRKQGCMLTTSDRTIHVPYQRTELSKQAKKLVADYHYAIQIIIV